MGLKPSPSEFAPIGTVVTVFPLLASLDTMRAGRT
jgi:hypothetical protein